MNAYLNVKYLIQLSLGMLVLMGLCQVTEGVAFALLIPITWAFILQGKNVETLFVILFSSFTMLINGYFMAKTVPLVVCQKILLLTASSFLIFQVFGRRNSKIVTPFLWLIPYLIFMFITSQQGWAPVISNLKLLLFVPIFFGMYGSAVRAMNERTDLRKLRTMYLFVAIFILYGSFLVWPFKQISVLGGEALILDPDLKSLYRGTTNHSQALGVVSAFFGTFLFCDWFLCVRRKSWLFLSLILCAAFWVYSSASRTAMATLIFGIGFVVVCSKGRDLVGVRWRRKVVSALVGLSVVGAVMVLVVPSLRERALGFIVKYGAKGEKVVLTSESILSSRQAKLDGALDNWKRSPLVGNGFQVSEEMHYTKINSIRDMLSAPVEKSTWTYAILEEGGIIGMILFVLFLLIAEFSLVHRKAYMTATMLGTVVMSNLGEFAIFAMSGGGGVSWSLIFLATVFDFRRLQEEERARQMQMMGAPRIVW